MSDSTSSYVRSSVDGTVISPSAGSEVCFEVGSDVPLLQDAGFSAGCCSSRTSVVDLLLDGSLVCVIVVLLVTAAVDDFFPRLPPPPDLSDSRRGLLPAVSVPLPPGLFTAAGCTQTVSIQCSVTLLVGRQEGHRPAKIRMLV